MVAPASGNLTSSTNEMSLLKAHTTMYFKTGEPNAVHYQVTSALWLAR